MLKIKFLRNILIISILITVIIPLHNIFIVYPSFIKLLINNIENEAVSIAGHFSSSIINNKNFDLVKDSTHPDFIKSTEEIVTDFQLMKLKLFSASGEITYSTDPTDIGNINDHDYFHNTVANGNVFTKVIQKNGETLEGEKVEVDVVETYVPIIKAGKFHGALEIYYDFTLAKDDLDKQLLQSSVIQLLVVAGFFVTLIYVLLNAKANIYGREQAEKKIVRYKDQLQMLIFRLTSLEDQERKRISEELHDNIGQYLAISKIKLSKLSEDKPEIIEELDEIRKYIEDTIAFTRSLTFELSSPILYQLGLEQALEALFEQIKNEHNIEIKFTFDSKLKNYKGELSFQLYKTVRELLINIVKHSQARKAIIAFNVMDNNILINVKDNGTGFDIAEVEADSINGKHFGLFSIRERISYFKGTIEITSEAGHGTKIKIVVPKQ